MKPSSLFRQAALDRMASPERLDTMMEITSPRAWLALGGFGVLLVLVLIWSVVGTVPIKVRGRGILIRGEAVHEVSAGAYGRVSELLVDENEIVEAGDVVARLEQPELDDSIRNKRAELESLMQQAEQQRRSQRRIMARLEEQAETMRQRIRSQEELVEKGLMVASGVLPSRRELTSIEQEIDTIRNGLASRQHRIEEAQRELSSLETKLGADTEVISHFTGRVLEITANIGELISPGNRLATLEAFEEPIEAVIFVPAADGKRVRPGMRAQISPSTVRAEEWGYIIGDVRSVSDYPVTPEGLLKILRNEQLVADLTGRSSPIEVVASLREDPGTASGFQWSSSKGPPMKVFSGTVCEASVTVDRRRPISYVLPILRRSAGIE